jgi:poly(3-hydroxybutyrate) depolymerase
MTKIPYTGPMFRSLAALFCALLLTSTAFSKSQMKSTFNFEGKVRTYYCFIPDQEGPLPLVVLLHGSQRNGLVMADAWKGLAAKQHFIIAAQDSYDPSRWDSDNDSPGFLRAMIDQVNAGHPVDASRIYLFGHSGGAVYALALALMESEVYAAVGVHAGALPSQNVNLLARAERKSPIAIWVGDRDPFFPADLVKQTKTEFESTGFHVQLTVLPNQGHSYEDVSDRVNREAWAFFQRATSSAATPSH